MRAACPPIAQLVAVATRLPPKHRPALVASVHAAFCCTSSALDQCVYFGNDGKHLLVVFGNLAEPEQNVDQLVVDGVQLILRHLLPVVVAARSKVNNRWANIQHKGEGEKMQRCKEGRKNNCSSRVELVLQARDAFIALA